MSRGEPLNAITMLTRVPSLSGLRSDSDMFTMGFPFRPWTANKAIADGADIYDYVRETAEEYGESQRA